jgi:hypothetical protein
VAGSLSPGRRGGLRPPPVAGSFFFLAGKSPERAVGGDICLPEAGGGRQQVVAAGLIWLND